MQEIMWKWQQHSTIWAFFIVDKMSTCMTMQLVYAFDRALVIQRGKLGQDHVNTASHYYHEYCHCLGWSRKIRRGVKKYQQAVPIDEKGYGSDSVQTRCKWPICWMILLSPWRSKANTRDDDGMEKYHTSAPWPFKKRCLELTIQILSTHVMTLQNWKRKWREFGYMILVDKS